MNILFQCDHCNKHCCVGEGAVGKSFNCPDCAEPIHAPEPDRVFPCPACGALCSSIEACNDLTFLCPDCEAPITIPDHSILICPSCEVHMELDADFYSELEGRKLECPECEESLAVPRRPRVPSPGTPNPHPPGFGNKTLRLDTILESIPQADQLRDGHCPFCGQAVEQYNANSYTCAHCSRQIKMTTPHIKRST